MLYTPNIMKRLIELSENSGYDFLIHGSKLCWSNSAYEYFYK